MSQLNRAGKVARFLLKPLNNTHQKQKLDSFVRYLAKLLFFKTIRIRCDGNELP